jgi:hypothetical protein
MHRENWGNSYFAGNSGAVSPRKAAHENCRISLQKALQITLLGERLCQGGDHQSHPNIAWLKLLSKNGSGVRL